MEEDKEKKEEGKHPKEQIVSSEGWFTPGHARPWLKPEGVILEHVFLVSGVKGKRGRYLNRILN